MQGGSGIGEHFLVGLLGGVGSGDYIVDRLTKAYGVFHFFIVESVVAGGINLVVDAILPVVVGHGVVLGVHVALDEILAPYVQGGGVVGIRGDVRLGADSQACDALLLGGAYLRGAGTRLVVVVHDVHVHGLAAVAAVATVVVEHVVAHVHALVELGGVARTQTRHTALVVGHQVVVERGTAATPVAAIAMAAFRVTCILQALGHEAPLHGGVLVAIDGEALVDAPTHRAVVDDDVRLVEASESVPSVSTIHLHVLVAQTEAHVAHNHIVGLDLHGIVGHADAVAWSGLAGDGHVALADVERGFEVDGARHIEDDGLGSVLVQCPAQRPFSGIVQVGHMIDFSAPATGHIAAKTLGTREGGCLLLA